MTTKGTSKRAETSSITKLEIISNKDENKKISLLGGTETPGPRFLGSCIMKVFYKMQ